jgi:hypothetical protein
MEKIYIAVDYLLRGYPKVLETKNPGKSLPGFP